MDFIRKFRVLIYALMINYTWMPQNVFYKWEFFSNVLELTKFLYHMDYSYSTYSKSTYKLFVLYLFFLS